MNQKDLNEYLRLSKTAERTRFLIEAGADVNATDYYGSTALMNAKSVEQVKLLDEAGADVNIVDKDGNKAIHLCRDNLEKMKYLIRMGADIEAVDENGRCPIHIACEYGYYDILRFLIEEAGVDPTVKDSRGHDAFYYSTRFPSRYSTRLQEIIAPYRVGF